MRQPFFFRAIPTYRVLPYSMILIHNSVWVAVINFISDVGDGNKNVQSKAVNSCFVRNLFSTYKKVYEDWEQG